MIIDQTKSTGENDDLENHLSFEGYSDDFTRSKKLKISPKRRANLGVDSIRKFNSNVKKRMEMISNIYEMRKYNGK